MKLLNDFPPGPLDEFRKRASFDWKKLKVYLDSEDVIQFEADLLQELQNYPILQRNSSTSLTLDEERKITMQQCVAQRKMDILTPERSYLTNLKLAATLQRNMTLLSPSSRIKLGVHFMFENVVRSLGSKRHEPILKAIRENKILGCFCLTEIGHGSNTQEMKTRATYDEDTKRFILNTPNFEAAKCWAGGLGQTATHGIVYAQLYTRDKCYGLHTFIVPIRNPDTGLPYPGVIVGDMGEKIGLNGVDNGFVMFDHYPLSRDLLLNKTGDVTEDGEYVTRFKNPQERYSASFGILSAGRVTIAVNCEAYGTKALTIAIRYGAVRKQFGDPEGTDPDKEVAIIEYQSHQYRLIPYLAAVYVFKVFNNFFTETYFQFRIDTTGGRDKRLDDLGMEIHAVSSGIKPMASWTFRDAIQESREACGGHGYLKYSGLGETRNNNDPTSTYEGENHILIQQTSNWLLNKIWPAIKQGRPVQAPMKSIDFLSNMQKILETYRFKVTNHEDVCDPAFIINTYQWLTCYLMVQSIDKFENETGKGKTQFWAKNDTQVFHAKSLAIAFVQHFVLQKFLEAVEQSPDDAIKKVLSKIFALYGLWSLDKFLVVLYEGGYASGSNPSRIIHESILMLCRDLKDDSVALIDAVAPADYFLDSVLGASDGEVYKRLQAAMMQSPNSMTRPNWWKISHELRNTSKM